MEAVRTTLSLVSRLRLASASPRRARILRAAGFQFEVEPSLIDEPPPPPGAEPASAAIALAVAKAAQVAARRSGEVVLGADTVVVFRGGVLGKPSDGRDATAVLKTLRGRTHSVITAVAIDGALGRASGTRATDVTFRSYTDDEIDDYVATGRAFDKAGSYGIQDKPFSPAARITGCYLNVVGLPVCLTGELLDAVGAFSPGSRRPQCPHDRRGATD